ncbi:hypothetical protein [Amycolatopsis minnesotensis]|uniref:Uncharacterized protein n=1 Tax=Amycolatopsis minnesotensis TaxID=337894 RepID=A0ABN2STT4_9PSEU
MSLLTRLRRFSHTGKGGGVTEIGDVAVVHAGDGGTGEARALAAALPADPAHQVVVADLPCESPVEVWEAVAAAVPRDHRPVRLIPGRQPLEIGATVPPWFAQRLGRPVLAAYGRVHHGAGGALFVHSGPRTGWGWFQPGQAPEWAAKRFPSPAWESPALAEVVAAGAGAVAEPVPAGMWIHPPGPGERFARERARLASALPCQQETPVFVLGSDEVPGLELGDVAAFWRALPPEVRGKAWFAVIGGVVVPGGGAAGPALAAAIGAEVSCYNGIPLGSPDSPAVLAPRRDGGRGWYPFARGLAYRPGDTRPRLRGHRAPIGGLPEIAPGVYRYAPDVAIEIVQAGLWVRPLENTGAGTAWSVPLDPACAVVLYETTVQEKAERMHGVAQELVRRLETPARTVPTAVPPMPPAAEPEPEEKEEAVADDAADTGLPLLSRLLETTVMAVPVRPSGPPLSGLSARLEGLTDERGH